MTLRIPFSFLAALVVLGLALNNSHASCGLKLNARHEYEVGTYAQLKLVGVGDCALDTIYRLTADIDASPSQKENCDINGICAGFVPIGHATSMSIPSGFLGTFHGGGHLISGLYIQLPSVNYVGLFAQLYDESQLDSLALRAANVTGADYVGALAGALQRGSARVIQVQGTVKGKTTVGGLLGWLDEGNLELAQATVTVEAQDKAGGLVGTAGSGKISNSATFGQVQATDYVGGLVGDLNATQLTSVSSTAAVQGNGSVGGLIGRLSKTELQAGLFSGQVSGSFNVGGLVGTNYGTIDSSTNRGNVSAIKVAGGLVGRNSEGTISRSQSMGTVRADSTDVGGAIGNDYTGIITHSLSTGSVQGLSSVGGLVGDGFKTAITQSYATGLIAGNVAGGLAGSGSQMIIKHSYSTATLNGDTLGGLVSYASSVQLDSNYAASMMTGKMAGGLSGYGYDIRVHDSHWDMELADQTTSADGSTQGCTSPQMRQQSTFTGWNFPTTWSIAKALSYPFLQALDNAPFAFPDTLRSAVRFDLRRLLLNDYDGETGTAKLLVQIIDAAPATVDAHSVLTLPSHIAVGQQFTFTYRVGELRAQDTLWGNYAQAQLTRDDSVEEPTAIAQATPERQGFVQSVSGGLRVAGLRGRIDFYTLAGVHQASLNVSADGTYPIQLPTGLYLVHHARYRTTVLLQKP